MAQEMERISPEEEEEPKKQPLEAKKCPIAAKLFCFAFFFFFFLMGLLGAMSAIDYFFSPSTFCIQTSGSAVVIQCRGLSILNVAPVPRWIHTDDCP